MYPSFWFFLKNLFSTWHFVAFEDIHLHPFSNCPACYPTVVAGSPDVQLGYNVVALQLLLISQDHPHPIGSENLDTFLDPVSLTQLHNMTLPCALSDPKM